MRSASCAPSCCGTAGKVFLRRRRPDGAGRRQHRQPRRGAGINALYVEAVRLFSNKKPIVAAVQGAAVGRGAGAWRWWRISASRPPEARFTANFVKLGFHPGFGITHTLRA